MKDTLGAAKLKAAHPVNYFPFFLAKLLGIAHPVNYSYLPPCCIPSHCLE